MTMVAPGITRRARRPGRPWRRRRRRRGSNGACGGGSGRQSPCTTWTSRSSANTPRRRGQGRVLLGGIERHARRKRGRVTLSPHLCPYRSPRRARSRAGREEVEELPVAVASSARSRALRPPPGRGDERRTVTATSRRPRPRRGTARPGPPHLEQVATRSSRDRGRHPRRRPRMAPREQSHDRRVVADVARDPEEDHLVRLASRTVEVRFENAEHFFRRSAPASAHELRGGQVGTVSETGSGRAARSRGSSPRRAYRADGAAGTSSKNRRRRRSRDRSARGRPPWRDGSRRPLGPTGRAEAGAIASSASGTGSLPSSG